MGRDGKRKNGGGKKVYFCIFFPLFLYYKICVSNFHKGNSDHYIQVDVKYVQQYIHGLPATAIQSRHPVSLKGYLPPSQGINDDDLGG
jgi:hypothetical protein